MSVYLSILEYVIGVHLDEYKYTHHKRTLANIIAHVHTPYNTYMFINKHIMRVHILCMHVCICAFVCVYIYIYIYLYICLYIFYITCTGLYVISIP